MLPFADNLSGQKTLMSRRALMCRFDIARRSVHARTQTCARGQKSIVATIDVLHNLEAYDNMTYDRISRFGFCGSICRVHRDIARLNSPWRITRNIFSYVTKIWTIIS